jgi:hypothetical protein
MAPGEYAILYSSFKGDGPSAGPICSVFSSLADAKKYAAEQVALDPTLRCRIYDHEGLAKAPIHEIRGSEYKGESEMSARFRRWAGSGLFFGGLILTIVDWSTGFSLSWPAMIGTRMLPVGLFLLFTELMIVLEAKRKHRREASQP